MTSVSNLNHLVKGGLPGVSTVMLLFPFLYSCLLKASY